MERPPFMPQSSGSHQKPSTLISETKRPQMAGHPVQVLQTSSQSGRQGPALNEAHKEAWDRLSELEEPQWLANRTTQGDQQSNRSSQSDTPYLFACSVILFVLAGGLFLFNWLYTRRKRPKSNKRVDSSENVSLNHDKTDQEENCTTNGAFKSSVVVLKRRLAQSSFVNSARPRVRLLGTRMRQFIDQEAINLRLRGQANAGENFSACNGDTSSKLEEVEQQRCQPAETAQENAQLIQVLAEKDQLLPGGSSPRPKSDAASFLSNCSINLSASPVGLTCSACQNGGLSVAPAAMRSRSQGPSPCRSPLCRPCCSASPSVLVGRPSCYNELHGLAHHNDRERSMNRKTSLVEPSSPINLRNLTAYEKYCDHERDYNERRLAASIGMELGLHLDGQNENHDCHSNQLASNYDHQKLAGQFAFKSSSGKGQLAADVNQILCRCGYCINSQQAIAEIPSYQTNCGSSSELMSSASLATSDSGSASLARTARGCICEASKQQNSGCRSRHRLVKISQRRRMSHRMATDLALDRQRLGKRVARRMSIAGDQISPNIWCRRRLSQCYFQSTGPIGSDRVGTSQRPSDASLYETNLTTQNSELSSCSSSGIWLSGAHQNTPPAGSFATPTGQPGASQFSCWPHQPDGASSTRKFSLPVQLESQSADDRISPQRLRQLPSTPGRVQPVLASRRRYLNETRRASQTITRQSSFWLDDDQNTVDSIASLATSGFVASQLTSAAGSDLDVGQLDDTQAHPTERPYLSSLITSGDSLDSVKRRPTIEQSRQEDQEDKGTQPLDAARPLSASSSSSSGTSAPEPDCSRQLATDSEDFRPFATELPPASSRRKVKQQHSEPGPSRLRQHSIEGRELTEEPRSVSRTEEPRREANVGYQTNQSEQSDQCSANKNRQPSTQLSSASLERQCRELWKLRATLHDDSCGDNWTNYHQRLNRRNDSGYKSIDNQLSSSLEGSILLAQPAANQNSSQLEADNNEQQADSPDIQESPEEQEPPKGSHEDLAQ